MINFFTLFFYLFFFALGAIVGSFLNVVALRLNTGKSIVYSRSACFNCGKQLRWFELIPVFSFVLQKGRCRNCKSSLSSQYIVVEIITGLVFAAIANMYSNVAGVGGLAIAFNPYQTLFYFVIFSLLIVITIYDLRHMIIPDALSYSFSILALGKLVLDQGTVLFHMPGLLSLLAGPILALPFAFIWLVSRGKWMGLGDAKLSLGIGWLLGLSGGFSSVIYAFWIGAVVSIIMIGLNKNTRHHLSLKSEVPFAPFLILGLVLVFFFNLNLVGALLSGWY